MRVNSLLHKRRPGVIATIPVIRGWLAGVVLMALLMPLVAAAVTTISQGYSTEEDLPLGSLVSLKKNTTDQVVATTSSNVGSIIGIVINDGSSLLTLSNGSKNQVQVATSGHVPMLVSDINGEVQTGDQITASPIKGVGMKATSNTKVVGIAQGEPINLGDERHTYKDSEGNEQAVKLGQVPVQVSVSYYFKQPDQTIIPAAIQKIANALAGKQVNTLPILISAGIFIVTLIVVSSIIYSMIRSSIISVGRNPMAQSAVYRDVIQLSALVLGILAVAVVAIYLVLTRL